MDIETRGDKVERLRILLKELSEDMYSWEIRELVEQFLHTMEVEKEK